MPFTTLRSPPFGASRLMVIFSGRTAMQAPPSSPAVSSQATVRSASSVVRAHGDAAFAAPSTRPSIRLMLPTKPAT